MEAGGDRVGTRGISEIGDSESVAVKRQRKGYVRDGPTVYKLVKPVMKAIKEAHSLEYVILLVGDWLVVGHIERLLVFSWNCLIDGIYQTTTRSLRILSR
jgi:hypothetical protein